MRVTLSESQDYDSQVLKTRQFIWSRIHLYPAYEDWQGIQMRVIIS